MKKDGNIIYLIILVITILVFNIFTIINFMENNIGIIINLCLSIFIWIVNYLQNSFGGLFIFIIIFFIIKSFFYKFLTLKELDSRYYKKIKELNEKINITTEKDDLYEIYKSNKVKLYEQKIDYYFKSFSILNINAAITLYFYNMIVKGKIINDVSLNLSIFIIVLCIILFLTISILYFIYKSNRIIQNTILGINK